MLCHEGELDVMIIIFIYYIDFPKSSFYLPGFSRVGLIFLCDDVLAATSLGRWWILTCSCTSDLDCSLNSTNLLQGHDSTPHYRPLVNVPFNYMAF